MGVVESRAAKLTENGLINDISGLRTIAIQSHGRQGEQDGYEFIHKSFGEYLTARAMIADAKGLIRQLQREDDPITAKEAAAKWATLVSSAELTKDVIDFLRGEAKLAFAQSREQTIIAKSDLTRVFSYAQMHGFPMAEAGHPSYRQAETHQRCAEGALLTVLSAIAGTVPREEGDDAHLIKPQWPTGKTVYRFLYGDNLSTAARDCIQRLWRADAPAIRYGLARLDLSLSWLERMYLSGANLSGADLREAKCNRLHIDSARLHSADLSETVDLQQDQINSAKGSKADTKLPAGLNPPDHWGD